MRYSGYFEVERKKTRGNLEGRGKVENWVD